MKLELPDRSIQVFTVISRQENVEEYFTDDIKPAIRLSDAHGFSGMLLFQSNRGNIEPWVFAQELLANSASLCPIVAVNPVYMHPFTVAKKILTLCGFYRRKIYLNLITGTAKSDMEALGDQLTHGERYERLVEYIKIIDALMRGDEPVTLAGRYYQVKNLQLSAKVPEALYPDYFIAGASEGAQKALAQVDAIRLGMARQPVHRPTGQLLESRREGLHFGIVARPGEHEAGVALKRMFPESSSNQEILAHAMKNTDSAWKKELHDNARSGHADSTYSLVPFRNFEADCPYHVGSYEAVADVISQYITNGISTFIIEIPPGDAEVRHIAEAFRLARQKLMAEFFPVEDNAFEF